MDLVSTGSSGFKVIPVTEEEVEFAAQAAWHGATLGYSGSLALAAESIKAPFYQIARAVLERGTPARLTEADLRAAKAETLDEFAAHIRGLQTPLYDRYTMRKLAEEATPRAEELRKAEQ